MFSFFPATYEILSGFGVASAILFLSIVCYDYV